MPGPASQPTSLATPSSHITFSALPRAGGCTKQACGFRDRIQEFRDAGYDVYGMSFDKPKSQVRGWVHGWGLQWLRGSGRVGAQGLASGWDSGWVHKLWLPVAAPDTNPPPSANSASFLTCISLCFTHWAAMQTNWKNKYDLPYHLLTDAEGALIKVRSKWWLGQGQGLGMGLGLSRRGGCSGAPGAGSLSSIVSHRPAASHPTSQPPSAAAAKLVLHSHSHSHQHHHARHSHSH